MDRYRAKLRRQGLHIGEITEHFGLQRDHWLARLLRVPSLTLLVGEEASAECLGRLHPIQKVLELVERLLHDV